MTPKSWCNSKMAVNEDGPRVILASLGSEPTTGKGSISNDVAVAEATRDLRVVNLDR